MNQRIVFSMFAAALVWAGAAVAHDGASHPPAANSMAKMWQERQEQAPRLAVAAAFDEQGRLWLARVVGRHLQVSHSDDAGTSFSAPRTVNPVAELISADGEARPRIAVAGGRVHVSWTQALPQPFAGHVRYARSDDDGQSFTTPETVNDDRQPITHRFNAMLADAKGVTLAWIDKRDGQGRKDYRGAAIYTARRDNGEAAFSNRKLADHSCECCRLAMAVDEQGQPLVFWRHIFGKNTRDFALAGVHAPVAGEPLRASEDGWQIDACPHHGGDLAVDGRGGRHLAWFTGAAASPGLHYRRIDGERMTPPRAFGDLDRQPGHPALVAAGEQIWLVWREFDGERNRIVGQYSADRGEHWSPAAEIASDPGAVDDPVLLRGRGATWLLWNTAGRGLQIRKLAP
ncbi:exo-alpha-sialidase [Dechloromonas sp. ZY10]|uniref:exo-alpha-sialidase n=1 Tax=Dechloromonas aquae TaxID=2664436 RepID=UPI0035277746